MSEYYTFLARAISKLESNTAEARQALIDHARAILAEQLRSRRPPPTKSEILRERSALEVAIRKIESASAVDPVSLKGSAEMAPAKDARPPGRIFEQTALPNGPPRGRITFSTGGRPNIELFKSADASTYIHLMSHAWLEDLMRDAQDHAAPDDLKADALSVLKWLGVKGAEDINTLHHDKFARGFETYVMERRPPSRQLAPLFVNYAEWLSRIYPTKRLLIAPLTDDIRGVFDRLLATPEQITDWKAERDRSVAAMKRSSGWDRADVHAGAARSSPLVAPATHGDFMDLTQYKQFWRGELSLGQAFWIMYFGVNFALGFAAFTAMFILSFFKIQFLVNLAHFVGVIIISTYALWSAVGMWRCSPIRRKDGKHSFIWPVVVKIIVIFSSISAISSLVEVLTHPLNPS
jgi:hypothetical protein